MVYQVTLSQDAASFFESSDAKLQKRLDRAFAQLVLSPYQHPNIKAGVIIWLLPLSSR